MSPEYYVYVVLGSTTLVFSVFLFVSVLIQPRLRKKYSVFSVKFGVDIVTAVSLIVLGCLDMHHNERECGATLVISASVPLIQVLLLLCEVVDWSLAAFSPVYFHNSSLLTRVMPLIAGAICSTVILTALIVIAVTTNSDSCIDSPEASAVISAYEFSLAITTVCVATLAVLLCKNLNSSYFRPVAFHFVSTLLLDEIPLITCIALKYANRRKAVMAADVTNWLVCVHSLLHSCYFLYNHHDYREEVVAMFLSFRTSAKKFIRRTPEY